MTELVCSLVRSLTLPPFVENQRPTNQRTNEPTNARTQQARRSEQEEEDANDESQRSS